MTSPEDPGAPVELRHPTIALQRMEAALKRRWAEANGLIEIPEFEQAHWTQLLGMPPPGKCDPEWFVALPGNDHVTIWRRPSDTPPAISVVSQPYGLDDGTVREMAATPTISV